MTNLNCDNDKCTQPDGEVRVLPTGDSGNAILCFDCYCHELVRRHQANMDLADPAKFDSPKWVSLKVYGSATVEGLTQ